MFNVQYMKRVFKIILYPVLALVLYIVVILLHGTLTDWQPEATLPMLTKGKGQAVLTDSNLTLVSWNLGYGGDGAESTFFYDNGGFLTSGGLMVRPTEALSRKNLKGMTDLVESFPADFYLFQEADVDSHRSYNIDQIATISSKLPEYANSFALNYNAQRVPLPVFEPWNAIGKTYGGLATISKYKPTEATRLQLPGKFDWPIRIFQLDRCLGVTRFKTAWNKELVLVNVHNSAYDKDGVMKKGEMAFLKDLLLKEYAKGNYIICGGDWNQRPPNTTVMSFAPQQAGDDKDGEEGNTIADDFMPEGWLWAYDSTIPTNRSLVTPYNKKTSKVNLIDFFLLSPNVVLKEVHGMDNEFSFSDHQPVNIKVLLR
jgi:endonuclease/exonuclease/phosphatase family metal-dependent hydrolase